MGRKKTPGNRLASGKKKRPSTTLERTKYDHGNDRCVARLESFRDKRILEGKAAWIDVFDGVGQLHAIGMLDGHGIDGKLMREAGREYIGLYNYYFIDLLPKGCDLERAYGGRSGGGKSDAIPAATKRELRFVVLDGLLPTRSDERKWAHKILLDFFGLDTVHPLVDRLVNYRFNQWNLQLPTWHDRDMRTAGADDFQLLGHLLRGLFALADGSLPDRWKIAA